jgi:hypothetical protein
MSPQEDRLINLSVHESSDPEMLRRDAESKTGSRPKEESSDSEMLGRDADSQTLDDFNYENEEDREQPLQVEDFDISNDDKLADRQINIANRHAG